MTAEYSLSWENLTNQELGLPELSQDPPPLPDPGAFLERLLSGRPGMRRPKHIVRQATGRILKTIKHNANTRRCHSPNPSDTKD